MEGVLAVIFIFGGGTLFLLSMSPVGKAFADRLRHRGVPPADPEVFGEIEALRQEIAELHERVDFAERLLAQRPEHDKLPGSEGRVG